MKKANISTLKRDLSRYIDYVRKGGTVRVLDRDTPVADLVPLSGRASATDEAIEAMVERLEREGTLIRRGSGRIDPSVLRKRPLRSGRSVVEAIIEERRDGR